MRTRVKICCIASVVEARLAIAAGADAVGLVGAMPSGPGPIPDALIAAIADDLPPPVAGVLLTSETTADRIAEHARATGVKTIQIVSHVDPGELAALSRNAAGPRLIQVIHVEGRQALDLIPLYCDYVHAFLLDSGRPGLAVPELGGTGRTHDWEISAAFVTASPLPVFLAGGLSASNVAEAIRRVRPYGVDLCSGVRTDRALDREKLDQLMEAVRDADRVWVRGDRIARQP